VNHAPIVPVVLPALAAALMLLDRRLTAQRLLAWVATLLSAGCAAWMLALAADGWRGVYLVGNWAAPWGIVLVVDRLSALMLALTAVLSVVVLLASQRCDAAGEHFHPLLQVQLMGLNGAFLTGDLFNLFVFFEVLLIASYGLLIHGDGRTRIGAGLRFVALNLLGSAVFLLGASLLYGLTGTLNFADLAVRVAALEAPDRGLAQAAGALLLTVFALKAALLPLGLWLPGTYAAALAPVAALFAIMTKVGVYAALRVLSGVFGMGPEGLASPLLTGLSALGCAGFALATCASLGASSLRRLTGWLVVGSAGLLLLGVGWASERSIAATLVYLPHTTLSAALLFLVSGRLMQVRGADGDNLQDEAHARQAVPGVYFALGAVAMAGLPPFGGFIAKAMMLTATLPEADVNAHPTTGMALVWAAVLIGSLCATIALARAGTHLFWSDAALKAAQGAEHTPSPPGRRDTVALGLALMALAGLTLAMAPMQRYAQATAQELLEPSALIEQVLGTTQRPSPHTTPPEPAP
jgi:multicomponent K+:H+ antiporter subunit D